MYKNYIQINRVIRNIIRRCADAKELNPQDDYGLIETLVIDYLRNDVRELERLWPKDLDKKPLYGLKNDIVNDTVNFDEFLSDKLIIIEDSIDNYYRDAPVGNIQTNIVDYLHPVVIKSSYTQFKNGHFRDAVFNSIVAVFDLIRQITEIDKDGADLINESFSLENPKLILTELNTESGKNDQKGFMQIFRGAYQGIRNPKAHSLESDLNERKTAQYLIFTSLLARRIEESKQH